MSNLANSSLWRTTCCSSWSIPQGSKCLYLLPLEWSKEQAVHRSSIAFSHCIKTSCPLLNTIRFSSLIWSYFFSLTGIFFKVNFFLSPLPHLLYPISPQACFKKWPVLAVNSISYICICLFLPNSITLIKLSLHLSVTLWIFFTPCVPEVQCLYLMSLFIVYWTPFHTAACLKLPDWYVH